MTIIKKIIGFFLIFICAFIIRTDYVNADNSCYYMIGENNDTVIPNGYSVYCGEYYLDNNLSNPINGSRNPDSISLMYTPGKTIELFDAEEVSSPFLTLDSTDSYRVKDKKNTFSFNGLVLGEYNNIFEYVNIDSNIKGCPYSISWTRNNSNITTLNFSSSRTCSEITGTNYGCYVLCEDCDEDINYALNGSTDLNNWFYEDEITDKFNQCSTNNMKRDDTTGNTYIDNSTTSQTITTLNTCHYYFALDNYKGDECYKADIALVYEKITSTDNSTMRVSTSFEGVDLEIIENSLTNIDFGNSSTYTNISDYLVYQNGSWKCADKVYLVESGENMPILGQKDFSNSLYQNAGSSVIESRSEDEAICGSKPVAPDLDYNDDTSCNLISQELLDKLSLYFNWIKILACVLLILFGSLDYAKAVISQDNDLLKKATSSFIKRCIAALIIFFLPYLINLILNMPGLSDRISDALCGIS